MKSMLVYPAGSSAACAYAGTFLKKAGVSLIDHPSPEITHLLLDVPSFGPDGRLRGGGDIGELLRMLPADVRVAGGNLSHPALSGYARLDLLEDDGYAAQNAAITADCALRVAAPEMTTVFSRTPVLILGWGRIGKCLAQKLAGLGANVTVAARKTAHQAMIRALGFSSADTAALLPLLPRFRLIFNTVPELLLTGEDLALCRSCVKIDLASKPGMEGGDVIWARGLPGKYAPESSGQLIAETFLRRNQEGNV